MWIEIKKGRDAEKGTGDRIFRTRRELGPVPVNSVHADEYFLIRNRMSFVMREDLIIQGAQAPISFECRLGLEANVRFLANIFRIEVQ